MNFDLSEDVKTMREEVRRVLRDRYPTGAVRQQVESGQSLDRDFWRQCAEMGWTGISIPQAYGGVGFGYEALCMIAEEIGAALAPIPFASSIYLTAEALVLFGSDAQKATWLPRLAAGETVGAAAFGEGPGSADPRGIAARCRDGRLHGTKLPVVDGSEADIAIVTALDEAGEVGLWLVELAASGVTRCPVETLDLVRRSVRIDFDGAAAERLPSGHGWDAVARLLDRAAILFAFEQVGGARASLDMAVGFAKERFAFGRPIGSFQAIKHKLADLYVALELARSNAYYGAWALDHGAAELASAAAAARLSATEAFTSAAKENIQTHGGMGFTWESDCHLFYRRARELALTVGSERYWRDRLIDTLLAGEAA